MREFEVQDGTASSCGRTLIEGKLDIGVSMEKGVCCPH